ncbi:MAG: hypothetical protein ABIT71_11515 [Vicinamibacteraceae bacterium]
MTSAPLPLRLRPTIAAFAIASAAGSLMLGTCALGLQALESQNTGSPIASTAGNAAVLLGAVALWVFAASCVYAANQQWIGRARDQQMERFVMCLLLAIPVFVVIVMVGMSLYVNLGGRL